MRLAIIKAHMDNNQNLHFNIQYLETKGETVDSNGFEYYLSEENDWIYKKYHSELSREICICKAINVDCNSSTMNGHIYVEEYAIDIGKRILIDAIFEEYEKETAKIQTIQEALERSYPRIESHVKKDTLLIPISYGGRLLPGPERE